MRIENSKTWIRTVINLVLVSGFYPIWSAIHPRKATCIDEQGTLEKSSYMLLVLFAAP